jgi:broad specificity phosphatase PhoE
MTKILVILAGPTQWDDEDRLSGNHPLPLTELAHQNIERLVAAMAQPVSAVYCCKKNDACAETAAIVAARFKLKARDNKELEEMNLGLWQGLTRADLKFRYPKVVEHWKENPLVVNPPEGEPLEQAVHRIGDALKGILKRNRNKTIALALRPVAMHITLGILRGEDLAGIATPLQQRPPVETIELSDEDLKRLIE